MTQHPLEQLAATNPDAEIWWDSSPLIFASWREETLAKAPEGSAEISTVARAGGRSPTCRA